MLEFVEALKVILLGIVEGITEWLPISSTGHLMLVEAIWPLDVNDGFKEMFEVVIQLGAILAVVVLYFNKLNPLSPKKTSEEKKQTMSLWYKVIVACIPAAVIGLKFDDDISALLDAYESAVIAAMLILYGIFFIVIEIWNKNRHPKVNTLAELSYQTAIAIGLFQVLSLIPGTSRSGATIVGALLIGVSRYVATEFTFFLAIPVMFGASGLKIVKYVLEGGGFTGREISILVIGCLVSFVVSILAIKFLMGYIKKNDFRVFGYYRIALGVLVLAIYFCSM